MSLIVHIPAYRRPARARIRTHGLRPRRSALSKAAPPLLGLASLLTIVAAALALRVHLFVLG
jgi:hypothetical protein